MSSTTDQNLLLGIVALTHQLISREQLIDSLRSISIDQNNRLDEHLVQQGILSIHQRQELIRLVSNDLALHNQDVQESLATKSRKASSLEDEISTIGTANLQGVAQVPRHHRRFFLAGTAAIFLIAVTSLLAASINGSRNRDSSAKSKAIASKEIADTEAKRAHANATMAKSLLLGRIVFREKMVVEFRDLITSYGFLLPPLVIDSLPEKAPSKGPEPNGQVDTQVQSPIKSFPPINDSKLPKIKAGDGNLDAMLDQQVQVDGIVDKIELTRAKNAANVFLRCENGAPIMIWIDKERYASIIEGGLSLESSAGQTVRVIGRLSKYGGYSKSFEKYFQVTIASLKDFGVQSANAKAEGSATMAKDSAPIAKPAQSITTAQPQEIPPSSSTSERFILAWNVESDEADPKVIAERLERFKQIDIVCLSEVHPNDFDTYQAAKGPGFESITSVSGNSDRLQIIFNREKFELLERMELTQHRDYVLNSGGHRSPLAARLRERATDTQFIVMVNHLARGNAEFRTQQAIGLREWARDQSVGVINVGDLNLDYLIAKDQGNDAFNEMLRDNVYQWVRPKTLVDTNWADDNNDGVDDYPNDILDFVFVAGPAKDWRPTSVIIVQPSDFPDDASTSDHRPIALRIDLGQP